MKYLLLFLIRIYQTLTPKRFRGRCLFKESCSNYVYRIVREEGLIKGLNALKYRYHNCRPNYYILEDKGKVFLITAKMDLIDESSINKKVLLRSDIKNCH